MKQTKNPWSPEFEKIAFRLFEEALLASDLTAQASCRRRLQELGLSDDQIENGFSAGVLEMARLLGRPDVVEAILMSYPYCKDV